MLSAKTPLVGNKIHTTRTLRPEVRSFVSVAADSPKTLHVLTFERHALPIATVSVLGHIGITASQGNAALFLSAPLSSSAYQYSTASSCVHCQVGFFHGNLLDLPGELLMQTPMSRLRTGGCYQAGRITTSSETASVSSQSRRITVRHNI
ncbi:hypothetical protein BC835DRAFT_681577 [Cytidiella melzeri]|nr:hypothetical protein BC835DRAFT_681577 [Cytidiella melzeri]